MHFSPEYEHLTEDELLHLAEERRTLTDEAAMRLDAELRRRGLDHEQVQSYACESEKIAREKKTDVRPRLLHGIGTKFYGRANHTHDPRRRVQEYDTTLWFVLLFFPVIPLGTYRIKQLFRAAWNPFASDSVRVLERKALNWEQILVTWIKAVGIVIVLRFAVPLILRVVYERTR